MVFSTERGCAVAKKKTASGLGIQGYKVFADVEIEGIEPGLLMNHRPIEEPKNLTKLPPEEQAALKVYRDPEGNIALPAGVMLKTLIDAGKYFKAEGNTKMAKYVAACVRVSPRWLQFGATEYAIDARYVTVRGAVILRHRPCLPEWKLSFQLSWNSLLLKPENMAQVLEAAGEWVGIGDYRPPCSGEFGRFKVDKFEIGG